MYHVTFSVHAEHLFDQPSLFSTRLTILQTVIEK